MSPRNRILTVLLLAAGTAASVAQTTPFNLEAYREFLSANQSLSAPGLRAMFPTGEFTAAIPPPGTIFPAYLDAINTSYTLTPFELAQLDRHGFVVTSRLAQPTFEIALEMIYHRDLPVFISTDAILQTIHHSYDNILKTVELRTLVPELRALLTAIRTQLPALNARYGQIPAMQTMLRDVDVYCTVPLRLLDGTAPPYFIDNGPLVDDLLAMIMGAQPQIVALFSSTPRNYDFSQFTVRGHYTTDSLLSRYFRAMIWLGRTEVYLLPPAGVIPAPPVADIQRQVIDAALIAEAARDGGALPRIETMNRILSFMVGESDNVTIDSLQALLTEAGVTDASALVDSSRCAGIQDLLRTKSYAGQRIISQILMTDPLDPTQLQPASAFLLLGQRFVIDSYVTGNVVYDKIIYEGSKVGRMLPSTLDVLFALGNNAAGQLLLPELETYHYAPNAAAMRTLVDAYPPEFWSASLFNSWLAILRTLNPPPSRSTLPPFMQTAAWWQEKMNTQLASWAQLRHDNILYAKQSYSGGVICSYPQSYVEPIPSFFEAVVRYADVGAARFGEIGDAQTQGYFFRLAGVADTLKGIAEKELAGTALDDGELTFLRRMLIIGRMCGEPTTGWYPALNYGPSSANVVVADVHTAPTDAAGNPVGWVLHVGTGMAEMAVVCATLPGAGLHAFIGPVMSFYEHLATNFKRLTDEEWKVAYAAAPSLRPDWVNLYLANAQGESRGSGPSLLTGAPDNRDLPIPASAVLYPNYPNPFNATTVIPFSVTGAGQKITLEIYDIHGQLVKRLWDGPLERGNYTMGWDGRSATGLPAASGAYLCRLKTRSAAWTQKMALVR